MLGLRADHCHNQLSCNEFVCREQHTRKLTYKRAQGLGPACGAGSHHEFPPAGSSAGKSLTRCWPAAAGCPRMGAAHWTPRSRRCSQLRRCPQHMSAKHQWGDEILAAKAEESFHLPLTDMNTCSLAGTCLMVGSCLHCCQWLQRHRQKAGLHSQMGTPGLLVSQPALQTDPRRRVREPYCQCQYVPCQGPVQQVAASRNRIL